MTRCSTFIRLPHAALLAGLLAACGGGSDAPAGAPTPAANTAPSAVAGSAQTVPVGSTVSLNGAASADADGDNLTYAWALSTRPAGSAAALNGAATVSPTFTADVAGTYVATLVVSDGRASSAPATTTITASAGSTANRAPAANAGPDRSVFVNNQLLVDGSGSSDPDGDTLRFNWTVSSRPNGSTVALGAADTATPRFQANLPGTYVLTLIVNDGSANSAPDSMTVTVTDRP